MFVADMKQKSDFPKMELGRPADGIRASCSALPLTSRFLTASSPGLSPFARLEQLVGSPFCNSPLHMLSDSSLVSSTLWLHLPVLEPPLGCLTRLPLALSSGSLSNQPCPGPGRVLSAAALATSLRGGSTSGQDASAARFFTVWATGCDPEMAPSPWVYFPTIWLI